MTEQPLDRPAARSCGSPRRTDLRSTAAGLPGRAPRPRRAHDHGYDELWRWSVDDLEGFWVVVELVVRRAVARRAARVLADGAAPCPGARWFPGATLNYAEHALRPAEATPDASPSSPTARPAAAPSSPGPSCATQVARCRGRAPPRSASGRGDRVAAYLPNIPETLVAFLAAASLGAVWSSCPPEFGVRARGRPVRPRSSRRCCSRSTATATATRTIDRAAEVAAIGAAPPALATSCRPLPHGEPASDDRRRPRWADLLRRARAPLEFEPVPFDHPLYVLFSSGTTGLPKPIVHGHGGILLEHLKMLALHHDLGPGDRFFWFSTTGWMMWNYLVSGLLVGATIVLFDGDPASPDLGALWRLAADERLTCSASSAPFLMACRKAGLVPDHDLDLAALRGVGSTGAPLPAEGFRWVYEPSAPTCSSARSAAAPTCAPRSSAACPLLPVRAGEITVPLLGATCEAFDDDGEPCRLASTASWSSPRRCRRCRWASGATPTAAATAPPTSTTTPGSGATATGSPSSRRGSCIITGRSDATLNRGGVRLGHQRLLRGGRGAPRGRRQPRRPPRGRGDGGAGRAAAVRAARTAARRSTTTCAAGSPARCAPSCRPATSPTASSAVPVVPRTLSGKKLEVPVKRILGRRRHRRRRVPGFTGRSHRA